MKLYNVMLNKMMGAAEERRRATDLSSKTMWAFPVPKNVIEAYESAHQLDIEAIKILKDMPKFKSVADAEWMEFSLGTCSTHGVAVFLSIDPGGEYEARDICTICLYNLLHDLFNTEETK